MRYAAATARLLGWALVGGWTALCVLAVAPRTWGLPLALVATAAAVVAVRRGVGRLGFCLGWTGVVAVALPARPEGDVVITAGLHGWALVLAAFAVLVAGIATLPAPARIRHQAPPST